MKKASFLRVRSVRASGALVLVLAGAGLVSSLLRAAPSATVEESEPQEPNQAYLGWAAFQPGAWVAKKYASTPDAEITEVLKSVTSTEAVVETRWSLPGMGVVRTAIEKVPARIKKAARGDAAVKISEEVLTISGKQVRCRVERGPALAIWHAPEIPGGLARLETMFTGEWVVAWGEKP